MTDREVKKWINEFVPFQLLDDFNDRISKIDSTLEMKEEYLRHNLRKAKEDAMYSEEEYKRYLRSIT